MTVSASVSSGAELRHVARLLRKAAAKDLTLEMRKAQREAVKPLRAEVRASAAATLPKRGGYAGIMARQVRVSTNATRPGTLSVRIWARGKVEHRDVRTIDAGRLRHPVWGNRRNWSTTNVVPGFASRAVDRVADRVLDEATEGIERIMLRLAKG